MDFASIKSGFTENPVSNCVQGCWTGGVRKRQRHRCPSGKESLLVYGTDTTAGAFKRSKSHRRFCRCRYLFEQPRIYPSCFGDAAV